MIKQNSIHIGSLAVCGAVSAATFSALGWWGAFTALPVIVFVMYCASEAIDRADMIDRINQPRGQPHGDALSKAQRAAEIHRGGDA